MNTLFDSVPHSRIVCEGVLISTFFYSYSLIEGAVRSHPRARKINQADFTGWMSLLSSNLMEEISPNTEAFSSNT